MDYDELVEKAIEKLKLGSEGGTCDSISTAGVGYAILALTVAIRESTKKQ